jgi:hypothetical protein
MDRFSCIWYVSPLHIVLGGMFSEIGIYHPNLAHRAYSKHLLNEKGDLVEIIAADTP